MLAAQGDSGARLRYGFRLTTARDPSPKELAVLRDTLKEQTAHYSADPEASAKLVHVGESPSSGDPKELAAWTIVASVLLNLDEVVTKQ
jgi:hypothetical protein